MKREGRAAGAQGRTLRTVSLVTIVLAVALALYAIRLGRQLGEPAEVSPVVERTLARIVVAAQAIEPGREIPPEALRLEEVSFEPQGAFRRLEDVAGRVSATALVPGEPVMEKHFRVDGAITRRLQPGERAMAVAVDGVIGMGGFIRPGDRVDVLLFVARDQREVGDSHARVLLEDIRVLAFGAVVESDETENGKPTDARTAVLAVPEDLASRLMLGASKGRLRLALRSPGEAQTTARRRDSSISLERLAGSFASRDDEHPLGRQEERLPRKVVYRGEPGEITRY